MTLLNLAEAHEDDESYMSPLDLLFHEIESGQSYQKVSDKAFSSMQMCAALQTEPTPAMLGENRDTDQAGKRL